MSGSTNDSAGRAVPPPHERPATRRLLACLSVLLGTAAIGAHAALYGYWIVDDAAITFSYARSLTEGWGFVVQQGGTTVEGFSNPAWLALLVLGRSLGLFDHGTLLGIPDYVLYPKALALLCCAGMLLGVYLAAVRVTRRPWLATLAGGLILAAIPSLVMWAFSGLENPLYAVIVVWLTVLVFRAALDDRLLSTRVAVAAGSLAAVAALTRPDGLLYGGVYPLVALLLMLHTPHGRPVRATLRHVALSVAVFTVPVGGYYLWRRAYFGHWVPNTAIAKEQTAPDLGDIARTGELVTYLGAPAVVVLAVVVILAFTRRLWWRRGLVALLVPLAFALVAFVVLNPDWMVQYRFATPVWAGLALLAPLVTPDVMRGLSRSGKQLLTTALAVSLLAGGANMAGAAQQARDTLTVPMCYVADRLGRTFNGYADVLGLLGGSFLLPDLGGSSLTSRLHLVDMAGLVTPRIAEFIRNDDMPGLRDYVFEEVEPTFVHSRGPWAAGNGISSDPRMRQDYYALYIYPDSDPPNGDWVRKSAVDNTAQLERLRSYARSHAVYVDEHSDEWDRRHCGDRLSPGQTTVGTT